MPILVYFRKFINILTPTEFYTILIVYAIIYAGSAVSSSQVAIKTSFYPAMLCLYFHFYKMGGSFWQKPSLVIFFNY